MNNCGYFRKGTESSRNQMEEKQRIYLNLTDHNFSLGLKDKYVYDLSLGIQCF
jgi:hypothetical protein